MTPTRLEFPDAPMTLSSPGIDRTVAYRWQRIPLRQGHHVEIVYRGKCARCERLCWIARDNTMLAALSNHQGVTVTHPVHGTFLYCWNCGTSEQTLLDHFQYVSENDSAYQRAAAAGEYAPLVWKQLGESPTTAKKAKKA